MGETRKIRIDGADADVEVEREPDGTVRVSLRLDPAIAGGVARVSAGITAGDAIALAVELLHAAGYRGEGS